MHMGSLIKVVASRLPRCVISPRTLAAIHHQRCFFSTTNTTTNVHHGFKNNLYRVRNVAVNRISSFVYENIINRFGLFIDMRTYSMDTTIIEGLKSVNKDDCLTVYVPINEVISHEDVRVEVNGNQFYIEGVVYDEFKAAYHMYESHFGLTKEEDNYYLNYKMREIEAYFVVTEEAKYLALIIPKFNAEERMMNQKKDEAGELKKDVFISNIEVYFE